MKKGDKVQFLSEKGGGIIAGFQGKDIALVEDEDGFQIPTPITDLVVMSSGDEYKSSKSMTKVGSENKQEADSADFNMSVKAKINAFDEDTDVEDDDPSNFEITYKAPIEERKGGNVLNLFIVFVPSDIKNLSKSDFACYIVNDSNYYLHFSYMSVEGSSYNLRSDGELEPNTKLLLETFRYENLNELERVRVQGLAFKRDKSFVAKPVIDVQFRIDQVKFYKLHAFQENVFFDAPAILYPIVENDELVQTRPIDASKLVLDSDVNDTANNIMAKKMAKYEAKKIKIDNLTHTPSHKSDDKDQILVVDLHADSLLDTTMGMSSADILNYQLDYFRRTLEENQQFKGKRIVFIHGKGEGVLRHALINELRYRYKNYRYQDASFQEYGYGATQVTIR